MDQLASHGLFDVTVEAQVRARRLPAHMLPRRQGCEAGGRQACWASRAQRQASSRRPAAPGRPLPAALLNSRPLFCCEPRQGDTWIDDHHANEACLHSCLQPLCCLSLPPQTAGRHLDRRPPHERGHCSGAGRRAGAGAGRPQGHPPLWRLCGWVGGWVNVGCGVHCWGGGGCWATARASTALATLRVGGGGGWVGLGSGVGVERCVGCRVRVEQGWRGVRYAAGCCCSCRCLLRRLHPHLLTALPPPRPNLCSPSGRGTGSRGAGPVGAAAPQVRRVGKAWSASFGVAHGSCIDWAVRCWTFRGGRTSGGRVLEGKARVA